MEECERRCTLQVAFSAELGCLGPAASHGVRGATVVVELVVGALDAAERGEARQERHPGGTGGHEAGRHAAPEGIVAD